MIINAEWIALAFLIGVLVGVCLCQIAEGRSVSVGQRDALKKLQDDNKKEGFTC